jgi:hypothetical protein
MTEQDDGRAIEQVSVIAEPPIPTSVDGAAEFQANHPSFDNRGGALHPDELYERYVDVLGENHEWRVYQVQLHGFEGCFYIWNHQMGHGIRFSSVDESFRSFVEAMMRTAEVVA